MPWIESFRVSKMAAISWPFCMPFLIPFKWLRKSGFLQVTAPDARDIKSLAKLEIPVSFADDTATRRASYRSRLGPVAASQLERKLRAQRHAHPGTRSPFPIDQRARGGPD